MGRVNWIIIPLIRQVSSGHWIERFYRLEKFHRMGGFLAAAESASIAPIPSLIFWWTLSYLSHRHAVACMRFNSNEEQMISKKWDAIVSHSTHLCLSWRATDGRTFWRADSKCLALIHTGGCCSSVCATVSPPSPLLVASLTAPSLLLVADDGQWSIFPPDACSTAGVPKPTGWELLLISSLTTASPASLTNAAMSAPLKPEVHIRRS